MMGRRWLPGILALVGAYPSVSAGADGDIRQFTVSRDDTHHEAWPYLCIASNGDLLCSYAEADAHGGGALPRTMVRVSKDQGRTWCKPIAVDTLRSPIGCNFIPHLPFDSPHFGTRFAQILERQGCGQSTCQGDRGTQWVTRKRTIWRVGFDSHLKLEFCGSKVTSDAGMLACRELDEVLGLTEMGADLLTDSRLGSNKQHLLVPLLR